ncbi:protein-serine,threonine phosphatase [Sarracenia purpurea var. burkii]
MDIKPENMVICFEDQDSGRCLKGIPSKDKKYTTKMRIIDFGSAMDVFTMKHLYDSVGPSRAEGKQQFGEGKQRNPAALVLVADRRCGTGALRRRRRGVAEGTEQESSHRKSFTEQHEEEKDCVEQVANLVACIPFASSSGFSPLAVDLRRTWPKAKVCSLPEACRRLSHRSCRGDRRKKSIPARPRRSSPSPSPATVLEDLGRRFCMAVVHRKKGAKGGIEERQQRGVTTATSKIIDVGNSKYP